MQRSRQRAYSGQATLSVWLSNLIEHNLQLHSTHSTMASSSAMHWLRSRSCAAVVGGLLSGWLAPQVLQLQQQQQQQQRQEHPLFVRQQQPVARAVHTVCHSAGSVAPICRHHKVVATTPLLGTQTLATSSSDDSNSSSDNSPDADNDSEHGVSVCVTSVVTLTHSGSPRLHHLLSVCLSAVSSRCRSLHFLKM